MDAKLKTCSSHSAAAARSSHKSNIYFIHMHVKTSMQTFFYAHTQPTHAHTLTWFYYSAFGFKTRTSSQNSRCMIFLLEKNAHNKVWNHFVTVSISKTYVPWRKRFFKEKTKKKKHFLREGDFTKWFILPTRFGYFWDVSVVYTFVTFFIGM